tara:strand:+ start:199 stop:786 length:588 start_codon:yes stop_codon:yes gene_type:complete
MEKREVSLVEGLKGIYNEMDKQGAFNSIKEKLLSKARIKKESGNTESNAFGPEAKSVEATDKKNINISAGGFKPDFTDIANYNPNVNVAANLGGDEGFYADAGAGASLQGGVNYNAEAGYKGKNIDAKVDTKGLQIGTGFGGDNNNVNVNLAQGFDGNTNVNIEGKKQLNKYLDLTGSADTSGNYRAGIGFNFKF